MKFYKILSLALSFSLIFLNLNTSTQAANIEQIDVKFCDAGDATYASTISNVDKNSNTCIKFRFLGLLDAPKDYSISLPTGFTYTGSSVVNSTITQTGNSVFKFTGTGGMNQVYFSYLVGSGANAGAGNVSLLNTSDGTNPDSISYTITANNSPISAFTQDRDGDGYIDGYKIIFSSSITAGNFNSTNLTIGGLTPTLSGAVANTAFLLFTDGIFHSGETPQILDTDGGIFTGVSTIANPDLAEEDGVKPVLWTVNGKNPNESVSVSNSGKIILGFSENMKLSSTGEFVLKQGVSTISTTNAFSSLIAPNTLEMTPASTLAAGTYSLQSGTGADDFSGNENLLNQVLVTIQVADTTPPNGEAISGTNTGILINSGNSTTNNKVVNLKLKAGPLDDVYQMKLGNNASLNDGSWEAYSPSGAYAEKLNWTLSGTTAGTKTVYVKFKDFQGNESSIYSDSIVYGTGSSYIDFDSSSSLYTDSTGAVLMTGSCAHQTSTGLVISTGVTVSVNGNYTGTTACTSSSWSYTFTGLTADSENTLLAQFTADSSVSASFIMTHPSPSCTDSNYYSVPSNATGTGSYPSCSFICNTNYHKESNACVSDTKVSSISNGDCTQNWVGTWDSGSYGACSYTCDSGYYYSGGNCINTAVACTIANGSGQKSWVGTRPSGAWGTCTVVSCNSGYEKSGNSCVAAGSSSSSSSSGGGGGGGGGYAIYVGDYTLSTSASDKVVETIDNVILKKLSDGKLPRPVLMQEMYEKYYVSFEKGTQILDEDGNPYNGKINAVTRISSSKASGVNSDKEIFDGSYALRAITIGSDDQTLSTSENFTVTLSSAGLSSSADRNDIDIFFYNPDTESYELVNENKKVDLEKQKVSADFDKLGTFVLAWTEGGVSESIGGGFEETEKTPLKDISNHWGETFIQTLWEEGVISGEGDTGEFRPNKGVNRAELLKMLITAFGYEIKYPSGDTGFVDVRSRDWFAPYAYTAKLNGMIQGYKIETQNQAKITRILIPGEKGELVSALQIFLSEKGYYDYSITGYYGNLTVEAVKKFQSTNGISNTGNVGEETLAQINSYYQAQEGEKFEFRAGNLVNRAEALAMVLKVAKLEIGEAGDFNQFSDVAEGTWYRNFIAYAFKNGIVSGKNPSIFDPIGNVTKAESAKIIIKTRELKN